MSLNWVCVLEFIEKVKGLSLEVVDGGVIGEGQCRHWQLVEVDLRQDQRDEVVNALVNGEELRCRRRHYHQEALPLRHQRRIHRCRRATTL